MIDFDDIWTQYYPRLRVFAGSFSGLTGPDREDCIQDIFLAVYMNLDRYDARWSLSTWIYRIARNKIIDYRRRRFRSAEAVVDEELPDRKDLHGAQRVESRIDIARALEELAEAQREAIFLYYSEELPVAEIAAVLGKPEGSVKSLLHRGRKALKKRLEEAYAPGR